MTHSKFSTCLVAVFSIFLILNSCKKQDIDKHRMTFSGNSNNIENKKIQSVQPNPKAVSTSSINQICTGRIHFDFTFSTNGYVQLELFQHVYIGHLENVFNEHGGNHGAFGLDLVYDANLSPDFSLSQKRAIFKEAFVRTQYTLQTILNLEIGEMGDFTFSDNVVCEDANPPGGGGGGPGPGQQCGLSAVVTAINWPVTPGTTINLNASIFKDTGVSIIDKQFQVFYMGSWREYAIRYTDIVDFELEYSLNNVEINVLGSLSYRLKVDYKCNNGQQQTLYSNFVSTYSQYTGTEFLTKFAPEISFAWYMTKGSTTAQPGMKFEYGFSSIYKASQRKLIVDGTTVSTMAPCGTTVIGLSLSSVVIPSFVDTYYGADFTVGNFHTHPPLTYCSASESLVPGPSTIDVNSTAQYPQIVRTYTTTVFGGHNIELPTQDFFTNSKTVTSY